MRRVSDSRNPAKDQFGAGKNGFKPGNTATDDQPTVPGYEWFNAIQEELSAIVEGAGLTLDETKFNQAFQAIRRIAQKSMILADTGAVNAYAAANSPTFGKVADLADGLVQQVRIATTNNGPSTYSPDGIGGDPILGLGLQPLQGGELIAGGVAVLFRMAIPAVNAGKPFWLLMECAGGAQQVAPATQALHAVNLGQMNTVLAGVWSSYRNLLVNGAMRVAQQYGNALVASPAVNTWVLDQWLIANTQTSKANFQQISGPTALGFDTYASIISTSAYVAAAGDNFTLYQTIEAQNLTQLAWGTPNAKPVSLQFVARASIAGTYSVALRGGVANRSYATTFTLPANTDTLIQIPNIQGDTGGTWVLTGTGAGLSVIFDYGSGSNCIIPANGSWQSSAGTRASGGTVNVIGTNGATLNITGVQLEAGPICTPFERPTPEAELARCQRYLPAFIATAPNLMCPGTAMADSTYRVEQIYPFRVKTRVYITGIVVSSLSDFYVSGDGVVGSSPNSIALNNNGDEACPISVYVSGVTLGRSYFLRAATANAKLLFTGAQL